MYLGCRPRYSASCGDQPAEKIPSIAAIGIPVILQTLLIASMCRVSDDLGVAGYPMSLASAAPMIAAAFDASPGIVVLLSYRTSGVRVMFGGA